MKGSITMQLSRENITQAVEDWLGKELTARPTVTAVDQEYKGGDAFIVVFTHEPLAAMLEKEKS